MRRIYMDHSATTPVDPQVIQAMISTLTDSFGNPSSIHSFGQEAHKLIQKARKQVAGLIGADSEEIVFTSGGTEADNMAIIGTAKDRMGRGRHIITSQIEHHAVLDTCRQLEKEGFEVTYLPVNWFGEVDPETLARAIRPDTILISIMHANNEIGTIQPIATMGRMARDKGIIFHTDAVQSVGRIPVDVKSLSVDLLSLSGHKFYGPKGTGALYVRSGTRLTPLLFGGGQERKWRSGTENVPGVVGLGLAAELARQHLPERSQHLGKLSQTVIDRILAEIPQAYLTGHPQKRLPGHASFVFQAVEGAAMLVFLDAEGIAVSGGSACTSNSFDPSHVLTALGLNKDAAHSSLRISLGKDNTLEDVERLMEVMPGIIERQRLLWSLSPH
ncbi:MAG TPA: cysteine desulfurase NifS [Syntrophomonadaceae bacterium]|nr:cysteine desulfurase NifS [Syntrophomonadaceae bacterium]